MRVVGYIREAPAAGEPAFAQSEKIRRWVNENGHRLIALCQDIRTPGHAVGREGLQSIVGITTAGQVDAVVVPALSTFADDKVTQEVIMGALRATGVVLLSTDRNDVDQLATPPADELRALVRHVLDKQARFASILTIPVTSDDHTVLSLNDGTDVVVELIPQPEEASVG